jgi:antitoxin VapB
MTKKQFTEQDLLGDLSEESSHSEDLAEPLPQELDPIERLRGSVKRYDRPLDGIWEEYFES